MAVATVGFHRAAARLFATIVLPLLLVLLAPRGYGQQTLYSDIWAQQNYEDGPVTVWGTGATDDTIHGVQHNVTAYTTLWGPNSSPNSQVTAAGYVSTLVSLAGVEGSYQTTSNHWAACVEGMLGSTSTPLGFIAIPLYTYEFSALSPTDPNIAHYARCRPGASRCYVIDAKRSEFGGGAFPQWALFEFVTFTTGSSTSCFKINRAAATSCIPDPRGPDNH